MDQRIQITEKIKWKCTCRRVILFSRYLSWFSWFLLKLHHLYVTCTQTLRKKHGLFALFIGSANKNICSQRIPGRGPIQSCIGVWRMLVTHYRTWIKKKKKSHLLLIALQNVSLRTLIKSSGCSLYWNGNDVPLFDEDLCHFSPRLGRLFSFKRWETFSFPIKSLFLRSVTDSPLRMRRSPSRSVPLVRSNVTRVASIFKRTPMTAYLGNAERRRHNQNRHVPSPNPGSCCTWWIMDNLKNIYIYCAAQQISICRSPVIKSELLSGI